MPSPQLAKFPEITDISVASAVLENLSTPIVVLDPGFSIRFANPAFRWLAGDEAVAVGQPFAGLADRLWGTCGIQFFLKEITVSGSGASFYLDSAPPTERALIVWGSAILSEGGPLYLLTFEDVTLEKRADELRARKNEALKVELRAHARKLRDIEGELRAGGSADPEKVAVAPILARTWPE